MPENFKLRCTDMPCPCYSGIDYVQCCGPLIIGASPPASPEALMRSRYTAYATQNYQYIVDTYAEQKRLSLPREELARHDEDTQWIALTVLDAIGDEVEFIATYRIGNEFYRMHERSRFVLEQNDWKYLEGDMLKYTGVFKPGRNAPCPCVSGKKFKKCCG